MYGKSASGSSLDAETNLHYNYYRDYDPSTGRYVESDPIGLGGGISTYGYVSANPFSYVDPTGLVEVPGYIPNSKIVSFVREKAAELNLELSKCSDKDILDFVKYIPKSVADDINKSWDKRPTKGIFGGSPTPEQSRINREEYLKERAMIDHAMTDFLQSKKSRGEPCGCKLGGM
ncbi:RHS repeat-associated core domain-containing protein [Solimicrobium silvestre]|uniref:RHS repeat-associated core domain n=1 Tax=Solimicrobium silvestre TaxID=2099400 RepID=A0A2S9GS64_9BURK|nr:RHS repeat-associated core domain [Solimicrobium silvestre]